MAMACLRLVTLPPLPPLPERSVPRFSRCMALSTLLPAASPYFFEPDFFRELELFLVGMRSSCLLEAALFPQVAAPAGCPTLRFLKGGVPRTCRFRDSQLTPQTNLVLRFIDDPQHPPFSQSARKGRGTRRR